MMEIFEEALPVAGEPILLKVGEGEREGMVNADDGRCVRREFLAEPLGEAASSPIPAWAGRRLNLFRVAIALGSVDTDAFATGFGGLRAGVIDSDVTFEFGLHTHSSFSASTCSLLVDTNHSGTYYHSCMGDYNDILQDALEDEGYQQMFEEVGPQWLAEHSQEVFDETTKRFTEQRLKAFYLANPTLANPAISAVDYARTLLPSFPAAALVFAGTSVELTWKSAILKPLVAGVVHVPALADEIVNRAVPKTGGLTQLGEFLAVVLRETAAIDFKIFKRSGSSELLASEMKRVAEERNKVLHQGIGCDAPTAQFSIEVADSLLLELLPKLIKSLGLTIDGMGIVDDGVPRQANEHDSEGEVG